MDDSRSLKSSKNLISTFVQKTFNLVLTFALRTVFIRVFGVEMRGISGLFSDVLSMLALADLGFSTTMTYSYYKPVAENDFKKIAALNHFYRKVYLIIAAAVALIGLSLIPFLKYIVNLEREIDHLYLYYLLTLALTVVSYLFVYKTTVLYAHQQGYVVVKYNMIMKIISSLAEIVIMLTLKNYTAYLLVEIVFMLGNNLYASHIVDKRFPYIKQKGSLSKQEKKNIFSNLGPAFIYKLSWVLINSTDNILISKMIGTVVVGYYSNYFTVVNLISGYVSMAFQSITASIGNLMVKESSEKQYKVFEELQVISAWFCIVIAGCVYALIDEFIIIWLGNDFTLDNLTVIAIGINFFMTCISNPIWVFREAAGLYKKTKYSMLICAVLNIFLSIALGKLIGLSGVLFASAIAKLLTCIWYEPIILFRDFFKKKPTNCFLSMSAIALISVSVSALLIFLVNRIAIMGILGFIIKGVVCFVISNLVFVIVFFKNKYLKSVVKRIKNILNDFLFRFKRIKK